MFAQGQFGVAKGHRHRGHRSAQFHRATGGGLALLILPSMVGWRGRDGDIF